MKPLNDSILVRADQIINQRSEEKERQYGPMNDSIETTAQIASGLRGKSFDAQDVFTILIALKFARHAHCYKEDNLLDACAYIGALDNYLKSQKTVSKEQEDLQCN